MPETLPRASRVAMADELAAAAELVMDKLDRVPVLLIRGVAAQQGGGSPHQLVRAPDRDLFR